MSKYDPAGEGKNAHHPEEYDTSLDYQGAINFKWGFPSDPAGQAWTYLRDIARIVPKEELDENDEPKE